MKWKQVVVGGIISGTVIIIIDLIFSWITQTIWDYNVLKLPGMRTIDDPVALLFFIYPWVLGFALSMYILSLEIHLKELLLQRDSNLDFLCGLLSVLHLPSSYFQVWITP